MKLAYEEARKHIGTWEWKEGHNPKIVKWFAMVGHPQIKDDETAWCAAFVGAMLETVGMPSTKRLTARSYLTWGEKVEWADIQPGDLVIFSRGNSSWQGHVAFAVKKQGAFILVLGGNQKNQVNEMKYPKTSFLGARRMPDPPQKKVPEKVEKKGFWANLMEQMNKFWRRGK